MALWVLGLNYQATPLELRERAALSGDTLSAALTALRRLPQVNAVVVLSTCNRTEVYADTLCPDSITHWFANRIPDLPSYMYQHREGAAARHLFRVATGLDSMVLGESQILGQVKEAWTTAQQLGTLNPQLDQLFQTAFAVAKRIRTQTQLGANPVSVASTAVRLAESLFAPMNQSTVLLIGAGDTIELTAKYLSEYRVSRLLVANRTVRHAQQIVSHYGGLAIPLSELGQHLAAADIVFAATAARVPILSCLLVEQALRQRRSKPMLFFDLGVPRNIDASLAKLADAYVYTIDDLKKVIEENRRTRQEAAKIAEAMIDLHVRRYSMTVRENADDLPIKHLRAFGDQTRQAALSRARQQLANGKPADEIIEQLAHTLTNRLLHPPTIALKEAARQHDLALLHSIQRYYRAPHQEPVRWPAPTMTDTTDEADSTT